MSKKIGRRDFLKLAGAAGAGFVSASAIAQTPSARTATGKSAANLAAPKMDRVRVGFIGVGARGSGHVEQMLLIDGVDVNGICDLYPDWAERSANACVAKGRKKPAIYGPGKDSYKAMLQRDDIDIVIISTPWEEHARMAVDAMKNGKHAFLEVPAVVTLDECWQIVETSEKTQKHCMMMENCCYGREELMVLNMCRLGVFGDLLHGEAAYIHDLRGQMHEVERGTGSWRTLHYAKRNGNLYPTHGLGPVCQYMNINRGDRMDYLTSMSSPARVRALYAAKNFPKDHKWNKTNFVCGDINTTLVKTVLGRTIMIQWDEQLPRPYTRLNFIQGTKGAFGGFPNRLALDGVTKSTESWAQGGDLKSVFEQFDHPLWTKMANDQSNQGGHGGMDFIMLWRIVYCLRNGLPMDQDVYDAAVWSAIAPLSEKSVASRSESVDVPDFTRGQWKTMKPLEIVT